MQTSGFEVNQENDRLNDIGLGSFSSLFTCNFYTDKSRQQQIMAHNLINMGTTVFGAVETLSPASMGLGYYIDTIQMQNDHDERVFNVVNKGGWSSLVNAKPESTLPRQPFNTPTRFKFNSFGFEDNSNQNFLSITCQIRLCVLASANCRPLNCLESFDGLDYKCY